MRRDDYSVRVAGGGAVPVTQLTQRVEVGRQELRPLTLVGEVDLGLDRGAGNLFAVEGGPIEKRGGVTLEPLADEHQPLQRVLAAQRLQPARVPPRHLRRHDQRARDGLVEGLDEVAGPALADPVHEPDALQLLEVVIDRLAAVADGSGDGRRRPRLPQCLQHLHPQWVGQRLECLRVVDHVNPLVAYLARKGHLTGKLTLSSATVNRPVLPACDIGAVELDYRPDALIAKTGNPLIGQGIYNDDGTDQTVIQMKGKRKVAQYDLVVESDAQFSPDSLRVTGTGGNQKFKVKYFDGATNITDMVTGAGYVITGLDPAEQRLLTLKVRVTAKAKSGNQRMTLVTWTSENDDKKVDAVLAITQRR
jgi:hypothetical protein